MRNGPQSERLPVAEAGVVDPPGAVALAAPRSTALARVVLHLPDVGHKAVRSAVQPTVFAPADDDPSPAAQAGGPGLRAKGATGQAGTALARPAQLDGASVARQGASLTHLLSFLKQPKAWIAAIVLATLPAALLLVLLAPRGDGVSLRDWLMPASRASSPGGAPEWIPPVLKVDAGSPADLEPWSTPALPGSALPVPGGPPGPVFSAPGGQQYQSPPLGVPGAAEATTQHTPSDSPLSSAASATLPQTPPVARLRGNIY